MKHCCSCKDIILIVDKVAVCRDCFLHAHKISSNKCDACDITRKQDAVQVGSVCLCLTCFLILKEQ